MKHKAEHSKEALAFAALNNITKWDVESCTCDDGITDAYGDVKFVDKGEDLSKVSFI